MRQTGQKKGASYLLNIVIDVKERWVVVSGEVNYEGAVVRERREAKGKTAVVGCNHVLAR